MVEEDIPASKDIYQELANDILNEYRVEENAIATGDRRIEFEPAQLGYDITLDGESLGNTVDNYFLVYLSELFEDQDEESLRKIRSLLEDRRTLQATELQGTITSDGKGYEIGGRRVEYSSRYFKCSCPDWKYRRRLGGCKHIAALRILDV
jgi:hypothetical protein